MDAIRKIEAATWRCFHCDESFTDEAAAREHFGRSERQSPVCQIDAAEYRKMEARMLSYNEEDSEMHRQIYRMESTHAAALKAEEEKGYARGLADGAPYLAEREAVIATHTQTLASKEAELVRLQQELNVASVGEFAAQSANRHLSALVDFERQVSERCMAVMKALMDAAEPVNNEFQDCHIDYAEYAKFVDAHAELLYVIKNGERPDLTQPPKEPT